MKRSKVDRENVARAEGPVEELTPRPNPPAECYTHRIIMNVSGKRFELTCRMEMRPIGNGPAPVIEMPRRRAIEQ